jgi:HK97 family phage portal protein
MNLNLGPLKISWHSKTYEQLRQMIIREKTGGKLKTSTSQQLVEYQSWVYSCVSLISNRVGTLPYSFYNKNTEEKLSTKNKNFAVYTKPFRLPNELMSFRFIKQFCQIQLDLCGMACIYPLRNALNQVWELWPLNMNDFVKIEVSPSIISPQVKYIFKTGSSGWIDFTPNELIVLQYPNSTSIFNPTSPIQAQAYATDIDRYIEVYERDFFKNSARIDFVLSTDLPVDQDKADEIKHRWKEKYQENFHDIAVLDSGLKPVPLNFTNKDFEFLNLANWSMDKILAAYGVPKSKLGFIDANRSGAVQSDIAFNRESIEPRLVIWDEELTSIVCESFDERLQIKHDNPVPRDRLLELQESKVYLSGLPTQTINEWRKDVLNKPPVDGGDVVIIPNKYIRLQDIEKVTDAALRDRTTSNPADDTTGDGRPAADGSDDRDDNPTDNRIASEPIAKFIFKNIKKEEKIIKEVFSKQICLWIKNNPLASVENIIPVIQSYIKEIILSVYEQLNFSNILINEDWIKSISMDVSKRYIETIFSKWHNKSSVDKSIVWGDYVDLEFLNNPRLSKITNAVICSCINYTKYEIIRLEGQAAIWVINRNDCGHRGRIKNENNKDSDFQIGNHFIKFPGETLNLSCDCSIDYFN